MITRLTQIDRGVIGCRYGTARPHADFPMIASLYLDGRLMLDELVSATAPLAEFETIVAALHEGSLAPPPTPRPGGGPPPPQNRGVPRHQGGRCTFVLVFAV